MTRRNFITSGTIPADVAALDGDQQSRMGYAVDRFAAAGNTAFLVTMQLHLLALIQI